MKQEYAPREKQEIVIFHVFFWIEMILLLLLQNQ